MKNMTAVEWLVERLKENGVNFWQEEIEMIEEAKEMEKEQICDAVDWGNRKGYDEHILTAMHDLDEQYYNETFK